MNNKYLDYYNLEDIWKQEITLGQVNTINQIIELLEELDVKSILDVGCGNGFLINSLPSDIKVVGMDISEEALKYVKREYVTGSIEDIPFEDNSFDLVVCSDVIEHLYEDVLIKGIDELKRVSKKYLLMIYPYREQLDYSRTKCKKCGCHFHINWHLRSLDVEDIKSRINDDNIKLEKVFFTLFLYLMFLKIP